MVAQVYLDVIVCAPRSARYALNVMDLMGDGDREVPSHADTVDGIGTVILSWNFKVASYIRTDKYVSRDIRLGV